MLATAALLVALQLAVRAWALFPSWFYTDDYRFLDQATGASWGWDYLSLPMDNHFMPLGRAIAYAVATSGHVNWGLAATFTWSLQLLADLACVLMLVTAFGARWRILLPLVVYLFSAVTVPAMMWWAAALNQLPLQVVLFLAVTTWLHYARTRSWRWLGATVALLLVGLLAYEKTLLVLPVLAFVLAAYFARGGPRERLRGLLGSYWPALAVSVVLGLVFLGYYTSQVETATDPAGAGLAGRLADTMLGTALGSGLLGGPWRWDASNPPVARAAPPDWAVHLSWVLVVVAVLWLVLTRTRTVRALAMVAGYAVGAYLVLVTSRVQAFGAGLGLEYRYLTDVVPVLALGVGLATMPLLGAVESSEARTEPLVAVRAPRWVLPAVVVALVVSGLVSTVRYVKVWHDDNPGEVWTSAVIDGLRGRGQVQLADQVVPEDVVPFFLRPYNTTEVIVPLLVGNVQFPTSSHRLAALTPDGDPVRADIPEPVATSLPGPLPGCGWKVDRGGSVTVPLDARTFDYVWWVRIGYLGSADDEVTLRMGDSTVQASVRRGLQELYVRVQTTMDSVTLSGMDPETTVCVDKVEVGELQPGGPL